MVIIINIRNEVLKIIKSNPNIFSQKILEKILEKFPGEKVELNIIQVYLNSFISENKIRKTGKSGRYITYETIEEETDLELLRHLYNILLDNTIPKPNTKLDENKKKYLRKINERLGIK